MPTRRSIRLNASLIEAAEIQGRIHHRSATSQIEYWASIGQRLALILSSEELIAIGQGLARIIVEIECSSTVDIDSVFADVARHQGKPFVSSAAHPSPFQFESSQIPGCIDRVDANGNRITGKIINGAFVPQ